MTLAFFVIAISQTFHVLNQRSNTESIFSRKNEQNYLLFLTVLISISVVVVLTLISGYGNDTTKKILGINFMSWQCFIIAFLISISILPFVEICKFIKRRTNRFAFL
jgi:Ca2+-transporting ATPase